MVENTLPGMSGLDLCRELLERGDSPPLVLMTGSGSESLVLSALKLGVNDYVVEDHSGHYLHLLPVVLENVRKTHEDGVARKLAEEALLESEEKYRVLYEGSRDGYIRVDMNGNFVEYNEAIRRMLGYTKRELLRKTERELTVGIWRSRETAVLRREVIPRGYSASYEKEFLRKDGSILPVELRRYRVDGPDGEPRGTWAFVADITERKIAEEELRKRKESLSRAF